MDWELQQQQVRVATVAAGDAPDPISIAAVAGLGMEFRVLTRHTVQVEIIEPGAGDELAEQLGHHFGVVEQAVVRAVMVWHASCRLVC